MILKRQGFFCEMPHGEENDKSIKEYINKGNYINKSSIIAYLNNGIVVYTCCGTVNDILNPEKGIAGVPNFMTDGTWIWPGDLSYYVEKYNLKISDEFLETMKSNNWEMPCNINDIDFENISIE